MTITIVMATLWTERIPMATMPLGTELEMNANEYMETLDYAEGLTPPRYPMPATYRDCIVNHNEWLALQFINQR